MDSSVAARSGQELTAKKKVRDLGPADSWRYRILSIHDAGGGNADSKVGVVVEITPLGPLPVGDNGQRVVWVKRRDLHSIDAFRKGAHAASGAMLFHPLELSKKPKEKVEAEFAAEVRGAIQGVELIRKEGRA
jgi:hypothetical protein